MRKPISNLSAYLKEKIGEEYKNSSYIQIENNERETVLSLNRDGLLLLIEQMSLIYDKSHRDAHYHLDAEGIVDKCDKPIVVSLVDAPWK